MYLTFGEWLREKRKATKMTQSMLGERVGLSQLQVSRLESGLQKATRDVVRPLMDALEIDPAEAATWLARLEPVRAQTPKPSLYSTRRQMEVSAGYRSR